jgi:glycosyltransferase involved in cell wall biosynthesis
LKYSIIIAVYNRLDEVQELLSSAEKMPFPREAFEILFVDDGSEDGFKAFIDSYESASELQIRVIYQQNQGPGSARNYGMQEAKGDYFIFVDSDCMFPPEWLEEIDKHLIQNTWDAFGGPDAAHDSFSPLIKAINYSMTSFLGTGGTRGSKNHVGKFYPRSFNMGISREVYEKIGGMNKLRHGQDMDYSARIYQAGFKVGLIPEAFVYHKRRTSLKKFFKQIFNWGVARINLGTTHPELLKPIHFLPSTILLAYLILLILSGLTPFLHLLFKLVLLGHMLVSVVAFFQAFSQYKQIKVALFALCTLNIQVFAYGAGLLYAVLQKLLGRKEAKGFVKNYYGEKKK